MQNGKKTLIIIAVALVAVVAVAAVAYGALAGSKDASLTSGAESAQGAGQSEGTENGQDGAADAKDNEPIEAPDFTVEDQNGQQVSLSSFEGKPVVINFWTSWCTYCKEEMPMMQSMWETYGDRVQFMMINATDESRETREAADAYIADGGFTMPFYFDTDGQALSAYAVRGFPTTVVVSPEGNVIGYVSGVVEEEALATALDNLL
ncbi:MULTISPECIES: TlpA family protein disulfide reductase [unclassified Adlercreutzia]|uniref:TlpA family protein disulfide reductase n=1 Tax=unclassified Adlercreutzia TaxID=2636013 RepID=UPI0013EB69A2|nr:MULTISPECIES: TlpA disulfide reductase family protein [unclassified Adlercreutzia]